MVKLHPLDDIRLTKEHIDYEVWSYIVELEVRYVTKLNGIQVDIERSGYEDGKTPQCYYAMEVFSHIVMNTMDAQPDFIRWLNNWAREPGQFMKAMNPETKLKMTKDKFGFVLQFWQGRHVYFVMRFDEKAPNPPGWKE